LTSPQANILILAGLAGLLVLVLDVLFKGPLFQGRPSFSTRVLFLLACSTFIGIASSRYRTDRYVYFLFPAALLCFLEAMQAYLSRSKPPVRRVVIACVVLVIALLEIPAAIHRLPTASGETRVSGAGEWLRSHAVTRSERIVRIDTAFDYRAAGAELRARMLDDDLLLADAAHQIQVYVPTVHGHLSPPLQEYQHGTRHYFTDSALLRSVEDLTGFLNAVEGSTEVWVLLTTGYNSVWSELLPGLLSEKQVWADGLIAIYAVSARELLSLLHRAPSTLTESDPIHLQKGTQGSVALEPATVP
jgi:hypothetical protein